jgi:hypothetical protein
VTKAKKVMKSERILVKSMVIGVDEVKRENVWVQHRHSCDVCLGRARPAWSKFDYELACFIRTTLTYPTPSTDLKN